MVALLILQVFLIGVSLSMDAFAVSITDGMCYSDLNRRKGVTIPLTFGIFQAVMPTIGFFLFTFAEDNLEVLSKISPYVSFALLLIIGGKMVLDGIKDAKNKDDELSIKKYSFGEVFVQGISTSIDALAVGATLGNLGEGLITTTTVWWYVGLIGVTTFVISTVGLLIGNKIGKLIKNKSYIAEVIGGLVLVAIGVKILVEGLL
jgi:putative Mn2+ efflux pump MntP